MKNQKIHSRTPQKLHCSVHTPNPNPRSPTSVICQHIKYHFLSPRQYLFPILFHTCLFSKPNEPSSSTVHSLMNLPNYLLIKPPKSFFWHSRKIPVPVLVPARYPCPKPAAFRPDPSGKGADWVGRMGISIGCFGDWPKRKEKNLGEKVDIELVAGGVDVMDAAMAEANVLPQHLVIMVNGLIGSASDWKFAADQFVKQLPDKVIVHRSICNPAKLTFDGVDMMGERLADEVLTVVRHRPGLQKISFVAHSLGGLVARYAIGKLYEPVRNSDPLEADNSSFVVEKEDDCNGRIAGLAPMNFITVATPHLGSRGHKQLPFLCGVTFLERQAKQTAHLIAGRSGKHLFLADDDEGRPPLLVRMVSDSYELKFISALCSFKRRVAYANVTYDHVVGWSTASIRRQHELPKANLLRKDDKYPHILYIEQKTSEDTQHKTSSSIENQAIDFEEEMIRGLNQVPWKRVDVSFHKSRQRYIAHNTIQVKSFWLNSDGVDVIFHMIDNFLL